MCGIAGAYFKGTINETSLQEATDLMEHRGPDASGHFISEHRKVYLGHRRLSIIDVSSGANQPIYSHDGRYVIVYNGEVYNFQSLKEKLPGFPWKTSGDTEVVLELFAAFGAESFAWLNGIFAFGIYDTKQEKLWLCRDQLGVKPLFVHRSNDRLIFASELKSVLSANKVNGVIPNFLVSRKAVAHFLHLGYIPEPMTIYRGIKKFPAGNYGVLDTRTGEWNRYKYWSADQFYLTSPVSGDEQSVLRQYREKLFASVERQMISDMPLGTFLSGGIDSSLVTAVAAQVAPKKISTFSIGFDEPKYDESAYAQQVADHLKTDHHLFRVKLDDVLSLVPEFLKVYDEPFADSSAFPTMLVSKLARQHVTVTLSGDGGDELFQGYGMYDWAERLSDIKMQMARKPVYWATRLMSERYQRAGSVFHFPAAKRIRSHIFSQEQYLFSEQELNRLLIKKEFSFNELNTAPHRGSARERQAFWDIEHYLKDDLLVKVDRASMRFSLEARVPLLDRELVEFCLNLPLNYKTSAELGSKHLMKRALYEMVPQSIFERPKRGFSIPLQQWLAKELRPMLDQYLSKQKVEYAGLVDHRYAKRIIDQYLGGKAILYNKVWALLVLHWWYYTHTAKA